MDGGLAGDEGRLGSSAHVLVAGDASLASRASAVSASASTPSSVGARYLGLPSLRPELQSLGEASATAVQRDESWLRSFNSRIITSDATAQALAAAMSDSQQNQSVTRALQLTRRHSAREDSSQLSSPSSSHPRAEDGDHLVLMSPTAKQDDKSTPNRIGKRMTLAAGGYSTSRFAAAVAAVAAARSGENRTGTVIDQEDHEQSRGGEYEKMMERFQLRRLQTTLSNHSDSSIDHSRSPAGAKSARVIPAPAFGDEHASGQGGQGVTPSHSTEDPSAQISPSTTPSTPWEAATTVNKPTADVQHDPPTARPFTSVELERGRGGPQTCRETNAVSQYEPNTARTVTGSVGGARRPRWVYRMRRLRRRLVHRLSTPMSPYSRAFAVRSFVILAACSVQIVFSPFQIAFLSHSPRLADVTVAIEVLFFVDFALMFNTSAIDKRGTLVTSRKEIAWRYIGSWGFLHLLASFPLSTLIYWATGEGDGELVWIHFVHMLVDCSIRMQQVVQILQLYRRMGKFHVGRSSKSIWGWLLYSKYSHLMRLTWLIVSILLIAHYFACAWKLLQPPTTHIHTSDYTPLQEYASCFYGAMQLLEGQGLQTETLAQNVFSSIAVLLGSVVLAIIYGHVTMLVTNFNANSTSYQRKMEVVFAMMDKMQLPSSLRERVHQYYQHLWREYESLDGEIVKFSKDLTHNLALEVSLFKYMELAMHVPFWRKCSPDFQKQLVLSLQVRVYLPDDFVMRRGEVSDEYYLINRGVCEIVRGKDSVEHCTAALRRKSSTTERVMPIKRRTNWRTTSRRSGGVKDATSRAIDTEKRYSIRHTSHEAGMIDETRPYIGSGPGAEPATTQLGRGQAFGEAALLLNYPRTANARAVTHVEMCILDREAFQNILARHPDDRKLVMQQMLTWLMGNNEFHRVTCPIRELVCQVFGEGETGGGKAPTASRAADLVAVAIDPLVEADLAVFFGTGLEKQLGSVQAAELAAMTRHTPTQAPLCSSGSCQSPVDLGSACSGDWMSLGLSLDETDQSQAATMQLVGKLCESVEAGDTLTLVSTPASKSPPLSAADNSVPTPQPQQTSVYARRRLSITRKRSSSAPMLDELGLLKRTRPIPENALAIDTDSSSPRSGLTAPTTRLKPPILRRNSVGRPLLRQMTSLIGFSRPGPTLTEAVESPTQLADQLFQQRDQGVPPKALERAGTLHSLSLARPNG